MILPLYNLEYELTESLETTITRFKWSIGKEQYGLLDELSWKGMYDTQKDWIGYFDEKNLSFYLQQPGYFFKKEFDVAVKGKIEVRSSNHIVKLQAGLKPMSAFMSSIIVIAIILNIVLSAGQDNQGPEISTFVYLFTIALLGFLLIRYRLKTAEKKLDRLFR